MYAVKVTHKDYVAGTTQVWTCKERYKTPGGAEKAARGHEYIHRPGGGEKASETWAEVVNA